jgi:hypothetical protein
MASVPRPPVVHGQLLVNENPFTGPNPCMGPCQNQHKHCVAELDRSECLVKLSYRIPRHRLSMLKQLFASRTSATQSWQRLAVFGGDTSLWLYIRLIILKRQLMDSFHELAGETLPSRLDNKPRHADSQTASRKQAQNRAVVTVIKWKQMTGRTRCPCWTVPMLSTGGRGQMPQTLHRESQLQQFILHCRRMTIIPWIMKFPPPAGSPMSGTAAHGGTSPYMREFQATHQQAAAGRPAASSKMAVMTCIHRICRR